MQKFRCAADCGCIWGLICNNQEGRGGETQKTLSIVMRVFHDWWESASAVTSANVNFCEKQITEGGGRRERGAREGRGEGGGEGGDAF
jgi:hypothetical protein